MKWWYLSPHLDDAVYSCGGLIAAQSTAGDQVHILTVCAGDPPDSSFSAFAQALHTRWGTDGFATVAQRRKEDQAACTLLGVTWQHETIPDCIYRRDASGRHLYTSDETLFGEIAPAEEPLVEHLTRRLENLVPADAHLVVPLTLGGHVDHRLVRRAAQKLARPLWYYADYPYARTASARELLACLPTSACLHRFPLSQANLQAWTSAMAAYASQLTTFWESEDALHAEMCAWAASLGGALLWRA